MMNRADISKLLGAVCLSASLVLSCAKAETVDPEMPASAPSDSASVTDTPESSPRPPRSANEVELRFPRASVPWLGVRLEATEPPDAGVKVVHVFAGSPAEEAGLQTGDIIVSLGHDPMQDPVGIANWVSQQDAGKSHPVNVLRQGQPRLLRVVLEGRPEFEDRLRLELVNRPAPEIAGVATFQGEASSLGELRGQVVILEFWASYCGVCRFLAPRLDQWHRTYKPQGAQVVGITLDPPRLGMRVAQRTGMSYTLASDPQAKVTRLYMADQIPVVVVIDQDGVVRDAMVGYSERRLRETEALIAQLLGQDS